MVPRRRRGPRLLSWTGGGTAGGCWAGAGGHAAHICGCWAGGGTAGGCWTWAGDSAGHCCWYWGDGGTTGGCWGWVGGCGSWTAGGTAGGCWAWAGGGVVYCCWNWAGGGGAECGARADGGTGCAACGTCGHQLCVDSPAAAAPDGGADAVAGGVSVGVDMAPC